MAIKLVFSRPNGNIEIVYAAPKEHLEAALGPLTDAQYEAHVRSRSIPADAVHVHKLPDDWRPPEDRTFRDAWTHDKGNISVDLTRAKAIAEKIPGLSAQDIASAKDVQALRRLMSKGA